MATTTNYDFRLHITGPDLDRDWIIPVGESFIGRESSCDLPLVYPLVSRRHARLNCTETACTITDLESANGTIFNGARLNPNEPVDLADQTHITIGPFEITVHLIPRIADQPEEQPAAPPLEMPPPVISPEEPSAAPVQEAPAEAPPSKEDRPAAKKPAERPSKAKPASAQAAKAPPPVEPPPPQEEPMPLEAPFKPEQVPGMTIHSQQLIKYLPAIYQTDFVSRFLGLFESILTPIQWNVDNFDMYLDPGTTPMGFMPWLAAWYEISFDVTWTESQRRALLKEAHAIYTRRGTRWALTRLIEIYTGAQPEIIEFSDPKDPFTFTIKLPLRERDVNRQLLEQLIDSNKPGHASYVLEFRS
jgi:phage tail-like protein